MKEIVGEKEVEVRLADGTEKEMEEVDRVDKATGLKSSDTVEINGIYNPLSPNYDKAKDDIGEE